ncbi:MAG TPA: hypothetical protein VFR97_07180 [Capillimicrobium sp.]|nr:hypothetical protein [Capillimicrobium sp.]
MSPRAAAVAVLVAGALAAAAGGCGGGDGDDDAPVVPTEPDGTPIATEPQGTEPNKGSPGVQDATGGKVDIPIGDGRFSQPVMRLEVGQIVVWTNEDDTGHTVRAADGGLPHSGLIPPGGRFEFTPKQPGRVRYVCIVHPQMTGTLVVRAR